MQMYLRLALKNIVMIVEKFAHIAIKGGLYIVTR